MFIRSVDTGSKGCVHQECGYRKGGCIGSKGCGQKNTIKWKYWRPLYLAICLKYLSELYKVLKIIKFGS